MKKKLTLLITLVSISITLFAQPTIHSFSPAAGPIGSTVTITGTNFSPVPANNTVYFGAVKATVSTATSTTLTVTVPLGATYKPISVTTNNLTAWSAHPFIVTFPGGGNISATSLAIPGQFTTGYHPNGTVIIDLDGDGKADIATANNFSITGQPSSVSVLRNTSTTSHFSLAPKIDLTTGVMAYAVAAGDLDGDGKPELVATSIVDKTVAVFRNTSTSGNISFGPRMDFPVGTNPYSIAISDLDGDGKADLAVANHLSSNISLYRNTSSTGNISFATKIDLPTGIGPYTVAAGDLDGDGKPDLAVTNNLAHTMSVFRNTTTSGAITFAAGIDYTGGDYPMGLAIGDLDLDGKPDLVRANNGAVQTIGVMKNASTPGTITFIHAVTKTAGPNTYHVAISDLNGDGLPDIGATCSGNTVLFQNTSTTGTLAFNQGISFGGLSPYSLAFGDMDNDGKTDLATADFTGEKLLLYRNRITEPFISDIAPAIATSGTTVTITGTDFSGTTAVTFGGIPAASFTVVSPTTITAVIGTGATGAVSVTTPRGTGTFDGFVYAAPPLINSFTPTTAGPGRTVAITGSYFINVSGVTFGGVPATSYTVQSANSITAVVAAGATGNIAVTTPYGTATAAGFTFVPSPTVTAFAPATAAQGASVTITGTSFIGATAVSFGSVPATSFVVNSATSITAVVGAGATGDITVTTPGGTATISGFQFFPKPVITSFTPAAAGAGTTITIQGNNFNNLGNTASAVTAVTFGGIPAASFTVYSNTSMTAVVGTGASGNLSITTPGGTATAPGFTFIPPPAITAFNPAQAGTGETVTITGANLDGTTAVSFGDMPATSFIVNSSTTITAVVGAVGSGNVSVTTPGGNVTAPGFVHTGPVITSFTPANIGVGTTVTITGANFSGTTAVSFGPIPATSFTVVSPTNITAIVAPGTSNITNQNKVIITTPKGTAYSTTYFSFIKAPGITSFTPAIGGKGTIVEIEGTDLIFGGSTVTFGAVPAIVQHTSNNVKLIVEVGTGASGNVAVTTPYGTATMPGFTFVPAPVINSFTPTAGYAGTEVTITGTDLNLATAVSFGDTLANSFTIVSPTTIKAIIAKGNSGPVKVTTPGGTAVKTGFEFTGPRISSFTPALAGAGATITIKGNNFTSVSQVALGGVPCPSFTILSPTTILAVAGNGASGEISVTTNNGTATRPGFTYSSTIPVITAFTPAAGVIGTTVTLSGANFNTTPAGNTVYFGPVKATVNTATANTLTVTVPPGASGGPLTVTANGLTAYANKPFHVILPSGGMLTPNSFVLAAKRSTGKGTTDISIRGDMDGDGKADLTTANYTPSSLFPTVESYSNVSTYRNLSTPGAIALDTNTKFGGIMPDRISTADMNGDGKLDLAVANSPDLYAVSVFRNTSSAGTLSMHYDTVLRSGLGKFVASITDLDKDGRPDIVAGSNYGQKITLYRNLNTNSNIKFDAARDYSTQPQHMQQIITEDLDGDERADILTLYYKSGLFPGTGITVFRNTSTMGTLAVGPGLDGILSTTNQPSAIQTGDISGDGRPDVAIINGDKLSLFVNTSTFGTISFAPAINITASMSANAIAIADVDGDGKPDLLTANGTANSITIWKNTTAAGTVSFATAMNYPVANGAFGIHTGDLDNDGRPELATLNTSSDTVYILQNQVASATAITSFTPATGPAGTTVTITGTGFSGATAVYFGDSAAASFTIASPTTITAVVGAGASGNVIVLTPAGTAARADFKFMAPPSITAFTPATAATGELVTITGTNFTNTTKVTFGGVAAASFIITSPTTIVATIGTGATGDVSVTTSEGVASLNGFTYKVVTAINEPPNGNNSAELTISPNPVHTVATVNHPASTKPAYLTFIDMSGRAVKKIAIRTNTRQTTVSVTGLPTGIYKMAWTDGKTQLRRTVMIN